MGGIKSTLKINPKHHQCNHIELQTSLSEMERILKPYCNNGSQENPVDKSVEVNEMEIVRVFELVTEMLRHIKKQNEKKQTTKGHKGSSPKDSFPTMEQPDLFSKTKRENAQDPYIKNCIQIISPIKTKTTIEVSPTIQGMCKDLKWNSKLCDGIAETSEMYPLVVLCPFTSRLEPDIDYALNGIDREVPFVVLIIHSTIQSALPTLPTALKLQQNEKYKYIEFIDIAFDTESKLHHCQMNETARNRLNSLLETFVKK